MKIVMIGQKGFPATWGGVEQHVDALSRGVVSYGHEVVVYTRPHYSPVTGVRQWNASHTLLRLVSLPSLVTKHTDTIVHTFISTVHAMLKERPDVYHFHSVGPSLLSWMPRVFRPQAQVVVTFHSPDRLHQKWNWFARVMLSLGEWTAVRFPHHTVTVSKDLQRYVNKRFNVSTTYIPNGVYDGEYAKPSMITAAYGLQGDDYILTVARLVKHKGIHHLIAAYKKIATDTRLVIVGDSSYSDAYMHELKTLAGDDKRILFTGFQTGKMLQELFSNASVFVHPSESEGLSIALLEAGSHGLPVVSSDIAPNKEVLTEHAYYFENADVVHLQRVLTQVLLHPHNALNKGKRLRQHVAEHYHWETVVQQTVDVYEELVHTVLPGTQRLSTELKQ